MDVAWGDGGCRGRARWGRCAHVRCARSEDGWRAGAWRVGRGCAARRCLGQRAGDGSRAVTVFRSVREWAQFDDMRMGMHNTLWQPYGLFPKAVLTFYCCAHRPLLLRDRRNGEAQMTAWWMQASRRVH
jgi:hypothetical protein